MPMQTHIRELDLVPHVFSGPTIDGDYVHMSDKKVNALLFFDKLIIEELNKQGILQRLSRLAVLQDHNMFLQGHVGIMSSLLELQVVVMARYTFSKTQFSLDYIPAIENLVERCPSKSLKIVVVQETKMKMHKLFRNDVIERLHIVGPCFFNVLLDMKNLRQLSFDIKNYLPLYDRCKHSLARGFDFYIHRDGLCCVDFGSVLKWCPRLEKFGSISLLGMVERNDEEAWINQAKARFFSQYRARGGEMNFSTWGKKRWIKKEGILNPRSRCWR